MTTRPLPSKSRVKGPWHWHSCFGGIMVRHTDTWRGALIEVDHRCSYSTAMRTARRMVKLLNAGEQVHDGL